jgi:hypothetical protein
MFTPVQEQDHKAKPDNSVIGGFIRNNCDGKNAGRPQVETVRPDEMSYATENVAPKKKRGWPKGKPRGRRTKLAVMGISVTSLDAGDPDYARCVRIGKSYQRVRTKELSHFHGSVSSGVGAFLASAALALATSRYLYEKASTADADRRPELIRKASQLSDTFRQNELAAWELCARENTAKRKMAVAEQGLPWLSQVEQPEKPKRGRPRLDNILLPPVGSSAQDFISGANLPKGANDGRDHSGDAETEGQGGTGGLGQKAEGD